MKIKHNKKRNTAFVYEALVKEATVAILKNDSERKDKAIKIIKKHFKPGSVLKKDLDCYRSLYENQNLDRLTAEKILKEAKLQKRFIDPEGLFKQQTKLIHDVNKDVTPSVFGNFVPNYKSLATIMQIFSDKISPKNQIILENEIIQRMLTKSEAAENKERIDGLVYKTFAIKFNEKYDNKLLKEQKELLTYYISSFTDNALELKIFLNDEIPRLKEQLEKAKKLDEIKEDEEMFNKTQKVIERLDSFVKEDVNENVLLAIMKTQKLVKEIYPNADNN
tara:strand:- start:1002 stop:1835 length:834 start_codon:yes stop_codon:yes gene_type:complete